MGEEACYLRLVDDRGRLQEGPVIIWGLDSELPPPGRAIRIETAEPSPERLQFLVNLAREELLVLLYGEGEEAAAEALAATVAERVKKK